MLRGGIILNDPKNNWFYKLCKKQCKKDILWLVLAPVCFALAIYLFLSGDGILSALLFIGLGAGMVYIGADALLFKLPKVKERLEKMNPYEYACLGESAPECINKTFYFFYFV